MARWALLFVPAILTAPAVARADAVISGLVDVIVDGGNNYNWERVELPNTRCGNGSQYKFFVHRTNSPNLLFVFEGGGACWDYDSCTGRTGVLGAANPNGIADDYMQQLQARYVSPLVNGADPGLPFRSRRDLPTKNWNVVFLPYCTGDVHIGNKVATYVDPTGHEPPLAWSHSGYQNTLAAVGYVSSVFPNPEKLLVTGFSAGGAATSAAYHVVRRGISAARGYLLNDSGPIYPAARASDRSHNIHQAIRDSWGLDTVFRDFPTGFDDDDFGSINRVVATEFPGDQIGYTAFTLDYNYSRFSYERFFSPNDKATLLRYWKEDQDKLVAELGRYENVSYFIPHSRPINESHCSTIITFVGSHACERMEKKRYWWEHLEWPLGQSWKCYDEFVPMDVFLVRFLEENRRTRIYEPPNAYNDEDPGMKLVAPIINRALGG